jgi:hypothetical protein
VGGGPRGGSNLSEMLVCKRPEVTTWTPDFSSSGQKSPRWTRLRCDGVELCNALEWVEWDDENRVQVIICEECGHIGCASGGYVRVSRLGSFLLWTPGRLDPDDDFEASEYRTPDFIQETGALAIQTDTWEMLRSHLSQLPAAREFPPMERQDLRAAWELEVPILARGDISEDLPKLVEQRIIAAHDSDTREVVRRVRAVVAWLSEDGDAPMDGDLVRVSDADVEAAYFDVPDAFDRHELREWRPYARRNARLSPVFRGNWALTPEPIDDSQAFTP